jgi:hypothetical protein
LLNIEDDDERPRARKKPGKHDEGQHVAPKSEPQDDERLA